MIALETRRLLLLPAHPRLARAALEYYTRNRDWLQPWEPAYPPDLCTLACQKKRMRWDRDMARRGEGIRFWLARKEDPGTLIGTVCLSGVLRGSVSSCYVGYKLDRELLCRGYMTEALNAAVEFAFHGLGLHRVEADIMPRNAPSLALAKKCGFAEEGLARQFLAVNGVWEDHLRLARLDPGRAPDAPF